MITDIKTMSTMDVLKNNDVFNIENGLISEKRKIAGVSWILLSNCFDEDRATVLRFVFNLITSRLKNFCLWSLVGNDSWQPDTRIVRYRKLWAALKLRGLEISHASECYEQMIECNGKIKFFGAKKISELSISSVANTFSKEHCSYLMALPENVDIKIALRYGWKTSDFDKKLLQYVLDNGGVLIKTVGEFDDVEIGVVGLAEPEIINTINGVRKE